MFGMMYGVGNCQDMGFWGYGVNYEVRVVEEDITETFIDAETGEQQTVTTLAGTYGRPSIYTEGMTEYNHAEILALLSTEEWTVPAEEQI